MIANPNDGNSPRVEVATPMIDVSAGGLITATTEQEKGYVPGGTKSATQQLTTQGAATVTPGTTAQTAVASGRYTTGDVVVAGDANLVPENIAEGVSIFGVQGTHAGGGGSVETSTVTFQCMPRGSYLFFSFIDSGGELIDSGAMGGATGSSYEVPINSLIVVFADETQGRFAATLGVNRLERASTAGNVSYFTPISGESGQIAFTFT